MHGSTAELTPRNDKPSQEVEVGLVKAYLEPPGSAYSGMSKYKRKHVCRCENGLRIGICIQEDSANKAGTEECG